MRLEIQNVSCGYKKDKPVLEHVTMELSDGDICCILGPNGVGKTTLFKTILGMLPMLQGSISINGEDLNGFSDKQRARVIAYVAQTHTPTFPYLCEDIVMMGRIGAVSRFSQPTRHDTEVVERIISEMGIDFLKGIPYTDISGGERQLLMIAKALAQEPDVLILDEPTANLDFGNMSKVLARLKALADNGLCIIFTSHLPDQALIMNSKVALISRNEPIKFGPCRQIVTAANLQKSYGAPVQVVDVITSEGKPLRLCSPKLDEIEL